MRILGIDPSTVSTGWAVIDGHVIACGAIQPRTKILSKKYLRIYDNICQIIKQYQPDVICCEDQFVYKNVKTLKVLSRLVGVIILSGIQNDIDIIFYSPTNVKRAFTGSAKASKQTMIDKAQTLTDIKLNSDMADAIAVAYAYIEEKKHG